VAESQVKKSENTLSDRVAEIYVLIYKREYDYREDTEITIGYFSSEQDARIVQERIATKPGFCEFPEGFSISSIAIGRVAGWEDGFFSEPGPPPKDKDCEYFDLPLWMSEAPASK